MRNQLLLYLRDIALAECGEFGQFAYGPASGIFGSGEGEQRLRDSQTDAGFFRPRCVLFRPDDRAFVVAAENQVNVARLVNEVHPRLD